MDVGEDRENTLLLEHVVVLFCSFPYFPYFPSIR